VFGVLGIAESLPRPYFGVISDGIHLHPTSIKIAFNAHPEGFILVTDAMHLVGLPDGVYEWTNGERIVKTGPKLILEGTVDKIAGRYLFSFPSSFFLILISVPCLTADQKFNNPNRMRLQFPQLVGSQYSASPESSYSDTSCNVRIE